jgi:hypothetical protein
VVRWRRRVSRVVRATAIEPTNVTNTNKRHIDRLTGAKERIGSVMRYLVVLTVINSLHPSMQRV